MLIYLTKLVKKTSFVVPDPIAWILQESCLIAEDECPPLPCLFDKLSTKVLFHSRALVTADTSVIDVFEPLSRRIFRVFASLSPLRFNTETLENDEEYDSNSDEETYLDSWNTFQRNRLCCANGVRSLQLKGLNGTRIMRWLKDPTVCPELEFIERPSLLTVKRRKNLEKLRLGQCLDITQNHEEALASWMELEVIGKEGVLIGHDWNHSQQNLDYEDQPLV
ncbi:hypothetical protein M422DRAFT_244068 [Sphaerobolus stellatus SS14]|nr:hypothetical protein M422DRAFT_244068 [Sphaerobolus stellatus SS14]